MDIDEKLEKMGELYSAWGDCTRCGLCRTRTKVVFGEGNPDANLMIIGEVPGPYGNQSGQPFDGQAGEVIDDMLQTFNSNRDEVFILNTLGCHIAESRKPSKDELKACLPRVYDIIRLVDPYIILLLGDVALKALTKEKRGVTKLAQNSNLPSIRVTIPGIMVPVEWPAFVTFHPHTLIRNWNLDEGGDVHLSYKAWEKAFAVSDAYTEHYKGTNPPPRRKDG